MTALDLNRPGDLAALEAVYWGRLEATLHFVFHAERSVAARYRSSLRSAPPLQRALALHDDPFDVAATLTGEEPTADRIALYDKLLALSPDVEGLVFDTPFGSPRPEDILSSARRDQSAPMVSVKTLNKFMEELGYQRLLIEAGAAYYLLERRAWKRPLLKRLKMETLPGRNADGEDVYGLDRVMNLLDGLQEFARRRKPDSSIIERIEKTKARLLRALEF